MLESVLRVTGHCSNCGAPFSKTPGDEGFCDHCRFPLPTALTDLPEGSFTLRRLLFESAARKDWASAAQVLERLMAEVPGPDLKAGFACLLGSICVEYLHDDTKVEVAFRAALEAKATHVPSFTRLVAILHKHARHDELEREYRSMIAACAGERDDALPALWRGLSGVYHELGQLEAAQTCLEHVKRLT